MQLYSFLLQHALTSIGIGHFFWMILCDPEIPYVSLPTLGGFSVDVVTRKIHPTAICQRCLRRICSLKFSALA